MDPVPAEVQPDADDTRTQDSVQLSLNGEDIPLDNYPHVRKPEGEGTVEEWEQYLVDLTGNRALIEPGLTKAELVVLCGQLGG
jgi:hypothetical protein